VVEQRVADLFRFIADRIQPRTSQDQAQLLEFIKEGEADANA
jgi:hypothetical protein